MPKCGYVTACVRNPYFLIGRQVYVVYFLPNGGRIIQVGDMPSREKSGHNWASGGAQKKGLRVNRSMVQNSAEQPLQLCKQRPTSFGRHFGKEAYCALVCWRVWESETGSFPVSLSLRLETQAQAMGLPIESLG